MIFKEKMQKRVKSQKDLAKVRARARTDTHDDAGPGGPAHARNHCPQEPPGPATRHTAAHLAPGAGPPQLLGLHTAHHGHLWRSVHLPRSVFFRVHRSAAAHPHAVRLGDAVHQRGLLLRHLCVPLPAGAAGAAPLGGHCRGLEPGWWHGPGPGGVG